MDAVIDNHKGSDYFMTTEIVLKSAAFCINGHSHNVHTVEQLVLCLYLIENVTCCVWIEQELRQKSLISMSSFSRFSSAKNYLEGHYVVMTTLAILLLLNGLSLQNSALLK